MAYAVSTPVYEGPFDLLLHLILRDQVDIYEVSLSTIVDAYLDELDRMDKLDLDLATEFLLIAATLVELKAKRLLPGSDDVDLDDELSLWEERDLLLARLLECKTFKDVGAVLGSLADVADRSVARLVGPEEPYASMVPDPLTGTGVTALARAFARVITPRAEPHVSLEHVSVVRMSVADAVTELLDELPRLGQTTFRELTSSFVDRLDVVVRFLAVLELYKQGIIELDQPDRFADIIIEWRPAPEALMAGAISIDDYEG
jgi:segregation and condensation protein A